MIIDNNKVTNITTVEEFFKEAISKNRAVEVHLSSEEFPHEIDLIPYEELDRKSKHYLGSLYLDIDEALVGCNPKFYLVNKHRVYKEITAMKINHGYSACSPDGLGYEDVAPNDEKFPETKMIPELQDDVLVQIKKINPNKDVICEKCGRTMFVDKNRMMMSLPPQYTAKCNCGHIKYVLTDALEDKVEWVPLNKFTKMISNNI